MKCLDIHSRIAYIAACNHGSNVEIGVTQMLNISVYHQCGGARIPSNLSVDQLD